MRLSAGLREQSEWAKAGAVSGTGEGIRDEPYRYQFAGTGQFKLADNVRLGLYQPA